MNYGKQSTLKKRKALTSRSSMVGTRANVSFIRILFLSLITLCVMGLCMGIGSFKGIIDNAPEVSEVNITPLGAATFVYDEEGNKLQKLTAPNSNRMPVAMDQIPEDMQHAVVAIEDERFYEHNGIDVRGILRAAVRGITSMDFSEGASTITQQLLKNNVFTNWTNESSQIEKFKRKFQEQYLAIQVEKELGDKNVILENYLNTINLGAGAYGVQAAAQRYFGKDVWDLNLSECATIAGITQNPTLYNPILNPSENADRREDVLEHMLEQEYITQAEFDEAMGDNVYDRIQSNNLMEESEVTVYSYFTDHLTDEVINDLQTLKGYSERDAENKLYSGGLRIFTTQNPQIQKIVDEEYLNPDNFPANVEYALDYSLTVLNPQGEEVNYSKEMMTIYFQDNEDPSFDLLFDSPEEGQSYVDRYRETILADGSTQVAERVNFIPQPQSSLTIIDQKTGHVKAIMGGRGEKSASLTLNRATDSTRQPGSTFKIPCVYAPALDALNKTLATTYVDEPFKYDDGAPVKNADNTFRGPTTIRKAIQDSVNVVAVKCLTEITPQLAYEYIRNFGFTTVIEREVQENGDVWSDLYQSMALGGLTRGVTNLELCASYATIANSGKYIKPTFYTKITDTDGNVIIDKTTASTTVTREATAWLLTNAMQDVVKYGTATSVQLSNMPVAGKTGTTEYYDNLWFSGFTPYYTCTVWSGYDNNEKLPDEYMYRNYHKILWKSIMSRIHEDLEYKEFTMPDSVEKATVCSATGKMPSGGCPTVTEYFETATLPTSYCDGNHAGVVTPTPTETPTPSATPTESATPTPEETGVSENEDGTAADTPDLGSDDSGDTDSSTEDEGEGGDTGGEDTGGEGTGSEDTSTDENADAPI
ncbi:MAG: PBP1A family penicillin-binding protein [Lachnospiraceae bacterium]|jgi:penicillin-binding protein 1A|nr:PBP1A family penicillin-binding protein [Lachnospiraceae bacterium]